MSNVFDDIGTPNHPAAPAPLDLNIGPMTTGMGRGPAPSFEGIEKIPWAIKEPDSGLVLRTLNDRGKYGEYGVMATVAQRIKEAMGPRAHLSAVQRESLDMFATKIARIVCGDPNDPDHWLDIEGYAKLARDRITSAVASPPNRATP